MCGSAVLGVRRLDPDSHASGSAHTDDASRNRQRTLTRLDEPIHRYRDDERRNDRECHKPSDVVIQQHHCRDDSQQRARHWRGCGRSRCSGDLRDRERVSPCQHFCSRGGGNANTNACPDSESNTYSYTDANSDSHADSNSESHPIDLRRRAMGR